MGEGTAESREPKSSASGSNCLVKLSEIDKRFGGLTALHGADFELGRSEVHALLGENGAGKTTLMNILSGVLPADAGQILIDEEEVSLRSPREAFDHGIGMVHQQYRLISQLTVAENLSVGWEETPLRCPPSVLAERANELAAEHGFELQPGKRVADLSMGERQRVAIVRSLVRGGRVLILDEPTAVLTPQETEQLFVVIRRLIGGGCSVVFISHKINEVLEIANRVTVMRGGRSLTTVPSESTDAQSLARLMVGEDPGAGGRVELPKPRSDRVLELRDVSYLKQQASTLSGFSLSVHSGEIVGIAGVAGNGQRELVEVASGLRQPSSGEILVDGQAVTHASAHELIARGVGHIPEDLRDGIALSERIDKNAAMKAVSNPPIRRGPIVSLKAMGAFAEKLIAAASLQGVSIKRRSSTLSGGQAQRLLVRRELEASRRLLVVVHPTRGLDVGATAQVRQALVVAAEAGVGVLLISEDLDELLQLSHRICVLFGGQVIGSSERNNFDRDELGMLMGGIAVDGTNVVSRA